MRIFFFLSLVFMSDLAMAGAWLQKKGSSELIIQQEYKFLTSFYIETSGSEPCLSKEFHFEIYDVFYQYGVNDKWTVGIQTKWFNYNGYKQYYPEDMPEYEFFESSELMRDLDYQRDENRLLETKIFAQTFLWLNKQSILSLQPNISFHTSDLKKSIGASLLYGHSFTIAKQKGFINLEIGIDASDSVSEKYEATLGYEVTKKYTVMLQSLNRQNTKFYYSELVEEEYYNEAKISLIYKYNKFVAVQTAYSVNVSQRDRYISESFIMGISLRF